jgi:hypothetical protein
MDIYRCYILNKIVEKKYFKNTYFYKNGTLKASTLYTHLRHPYLATMPAKDVHSLTNVLLSSTCFPPKMVTLTNHTCYGEDANTYKQCTYF